MRDSFDITILNPKTVSFTRSQGGLLQAVINNEMYSEIVLHQAFPFSRPARYISVWTKDDHELGIIQDIEELDYESKSEIEQELRIRYIIPIVTKILSINEESGLWIFQLVTDRGDLKLFMQNIHEHIQLIGTKRMVVTDMDGNRCEISDIHLLDSHSQRELQKII
ncbi:DUF1854 domain-containing protein [Bacillus sp. 1P10SD]|uniref:DUF1854 domain-containing protein n=1 Tax=Bacillus sp. 1P10SD TaxID=3132265 RepID=UPI0039A5F0BD